MKHEFDRFYRFDYARRIGWMALLLALLAWLPGRAMADPFTSRHSFGGYGDIPLAALIQTNDGTLYGTCFEGSANHSGTIYKISPDGTFTTLHSFNGSTDGADPGAALMQASDGTLYGTCSGGGANHFGTIFRITPSGTFTTLYSFNGSTDGFAPNGLIQASDGALYGTCANGGPNTYTGTIFRITLSGSFTTLYSFSALSNGSYGTNLDGANPNGLIQASDGNFYGTCYGGGLNGNGTIFRITPTGVFTTLHSFSVVSNLNTDGASPQAALIQARDGALYGTCSGGGANRWGTIFKITTSGTFTTLYSFSAPSYSGGSNTDGEAPNGLMQASDGALYGTCQYGGANNTGTIFKMTTGGTFTTLYSFSATSSSYPYGNTEGALPRAALMQASDGALYGTCFEGGANNTGTIFKITTGGTFTPLHSFIEDGGHPQAALMQTSDGNLYGTTLNTIFKIAPDGTFTTLYSFNGSTDGFAPNGLMQASDGALYGTCQYGGANNTGTIFRITLSGTFTTLYSFSATSQYANPDGANSRAALMQASDGTLYGTCPNGGPNRAGTIFKITTDGAFTILYSFSAPDYHGYNQDGAGPYAGLIQASDGALYGTCYGGGVNGYGTIFKITTDGTFTLLHSFNWYNRTDGANSRAALMQASDGTLYGTCSGGGAHHFGTIFKITLSGTFTLLHSFSVVKNGINKDGANPNGLIQASDGNLYGTCSGGGPNTYIGTIFRITLSGIFTTLHYFSGADGWSPQAALMQASDGTLYGTCYQGGIYGVGTVFSLDASLFPALLSISPSSKNAGAPAFTLTLKGLDFTTDDAVNWTLGTTTTPLTTTFVSATQLLAAVPAALITTPGTASVSVATPGGGTSNAKPFTLKVTTLSLMSATLSKDSAGNYVATLTLKNIGYLTAPSVSITKSSLNAVGTSTTLPMSLGDIAASAKVTTTLTYPASAGSSGSVVKLAVSGTFTGGTFSGSLKVTLP